MGDDVNVCHDSPFSPLCHVSILLGNATPYHGRMVRGNDIGKYVRCLGRR